MSIAQSLSVIDPYYLQSCPLCGRDNRIVVKGVYQDKPGSNIELYPDIGYSFCNCRSLFYTRPENLAQPDRVIEDGSEITITRPDPFFCEWGNNPYTIVHWNPRRYEILWNMEPLCELLIELDYRILSAERDLNVASPTPQHFHIKAVKRVSE